MASPVSTMSSAATSPAVQVPTTLESVTQETTVQDPRAKFDARAKKFLDEFLKQNNAIEPSFTILTQFLDSLSPDDRQEYVLQQNSDGVNLVYEAFTWRNNLFDSVPNFSSTEEVQKFLDVIGSDLLCKSVQQRWKCDNSPLFHSLCSYAKQYQYLLLLLERIPANHEVLSLKNEMNQTALDALKEKLPKETKDFFSCPLSLQIIKCAICIHEKLQQTTDDTSEHSSSSLKDTTQRV